LSDVVQTALEASWLTTQDPKRHVNLQILDADLQVRGDPLRLSQVFENLFNNAAKYSDPGTVVTIEQVCEGSMAVVRVIDQGIGIAPDEVENIFDMFAQGGQAGTSRSRGGLGIGLHLARQLIISHGGELTASSDGVGRGSCFRVRLPCLPHP
jgi:signal transduction histidine kinase